MHENEVEFLASRESQRNKAPLDVEYWRMMDEFERAAEKTREEFRRLATYEFKEMELEHPEAVKKALEEVNWAKADGAEAADHGAALGAGSSTGFDARADLHQMEIVRRPPAPDRRARREAAPAPPRRLVRAADFGRRSLRWWAWARLSTDMRPRNRTSQQSLVATAPLEKRCTL